MEVVDNHLGYEKSKRLDSDDARNGYKQKTVNSSYGSMKIDVPQDRKFTFESSIVKNAKMTFPISQKPQTPKYKGFAVFLCV